ncbi:restriction endonuclease subunit S [Pediococcus sp. EKM201D]|uniref:restriction endonuclease subunit S n=1 Tax=Pediococcus sp. EKM201D TaxID=1683697 RepID=UPI00142DA208|nr:restriction endonuclease subunit S [Pediococcus sp. EKM201D]KAF5438628.1 restriction endonuclease subunit S [Pediococcus sp. EKM201D]
MQDKVQKMSPEIRFKGYTDAWVLRKLNDIGNTYNSLSGKSKEDFNHGDAHYVTYLNVFNNPVSSKNGIEKIEIDSKQQQVKYGDIFFTTSSETPEEVGMSSVWIYNIPNTYLNSFCFGYRLNVKYNLFFLSYVFRNIYFRKQIIKLAQGISRYNISKKKVLQLSISIPKLGEQEAIGSLFKKFDDLIALQQRKIDTLKLLKKALLQQMFPEKGKDIPNMRFTNFNEIYQQRKLKELLIKNSKKNKELSISNVESVSNKVGFIKQTEQFEDYSVASSNLSNYYVIKPKQFAYNPSRINVGSIAYKKEKDDISVVSPLYVSFSTKNTIIDDNYLWFWFKTSDFERQRQKYSEGGVRDTLSFNQFSEMKLMLPNIKEQKLFGGFVKKSEYHLKLIEQKFNGLKTIKKALLQKMFI